jgi:outer membrane protein assembly factor BamB
MVLLFLFAVAMVTVANRAEDNATRFEQQGPAFTLPDSFFDDPVTVPETSTPSLEPHDYPEGDVSLARDGFLIVPWRDAVLARPIDDEGEPWGFECPNPAWAGGYQDSLREGDVLVVHCQSDLVGFDPLTGEEVWRFPFPRDALDGTTDVAVGEETVVVAIPNSLRVIDRATGAERWSSGLDAAPITVAVGDGHVYAGAGSSVSAFEGATGAQLWTTPLAAETLLFDDSALWAFTPALSLVRLDPTAGAAVWATNPQNDLDAAEVLGVQAGTVVLQTPGLRTVRAFSAETGEAMWTHDVRPLYVPAFAHVDQGYVVVWDGATQKVLDLDGNELLRVEEEKTSGGTVVDDELVYMNVPTVNAREIVHEPIPA